MRTYLVRIDVESVAGVAVDLTGKATETVVLRAWMKEHGPRRLPYYLEACDKDTPLAMIGLDKVQKALEPLAALADAKDAYLVSKGCAIPKVHEGDDSGVAIPMDHMRPFLRKRQQPHFIVMRDACLARKVLSELSDTDRAVAETIQSFHTSPE